MRKFVSLVIGLVISMMTGCYAEQLIVYPAPAGVIYTAHNDDYTVKVRKPGGVWLDLFEYNVKVDMDTQQDASFVYFDFSGKVEVCVRKNNGIVNTVSIRPTSKGIIPKIEGNNIYFTLDNPTKLSVEFNGDKLHNLHLFANSIETDVPDPKDTNVIYFGPGVHKPSDLPGDEFNIPSGKTVYIAGGAVVRAKLVCDRVSDVKIKGRGILDQPMRGVEIRHSNNISVEGIIVANPKHYTIYGGGSKNITIKNLKSFSAVGWGDGIDMMSCSDVTIDDVFMRNSDDCIAIYNHRWDFYGDSKNYNVTNSILWADVAHPINIGGHGNSPSDPESVENIRFKNIDILEQDEDDPNYQGCMSISCGDFNLVKDVVFDSIRVDDFQEGKLINLSVVFNEKYNSAPGRGIENVLFKNISYKGANLNQSVINGYDKSKLVKNITFQNLRINGKVVTDAKSGNFNVGDNVKDVVFIK